MGKRWRLIGAVIVALGILAGVLLWQGYLRFLESPAFAESQPRVFVLAPGTTFAGMRQQVDPNASWVRQWYWKALAYQSGASNQLKAGEYRLVAGITPAELVDRLVNGIVIQYELTVVEGWRFSDLRKAIENHSHVLNDIAELSDAQIMTALGREGLHPEGRFLPETYHFTSQSSALELLSRAMRAMDLALEEVWARRATGLPLETPDEVLILASIIEKETGLASEREQIAGVFVRRLIKRMRLQTDPTVIYGLGDAFDGNLRRADLRADTPYNTYTRHGLPPTPIALPGLAALHAAVSPAPGDTLFFVSRGDGSHQFSTTLAEHEAAVRRFQLGKP